MEIAPLGDSALILRVDEDFERAPDKSLEQVLDTLSRLKNGNLPGVIEMAPAYATIGLFFDPLRVVAAGAPVDGIFDWLSARIRECLDRTQQNAWVAGTRRQVEIPVCYEGEFALDLDVVAQHTALAAGEVVRLHSGATYLVHCVGFTPGFPYLGGLPRELATPRRATPRKDVPAGSVAIGGTQTGIYPQNSPGGWNIIGRTPLRLFDAASDPPALLRAGDGVRFRSIARDEFERLSAGSFHA
jgi:inhibitor of KinA